MRRRRCGAGMRCRVLRRPARSRPGLCAALRGAVRHGVVMRGDRLGAAVGIGRRRPEWLWRRPVTADGDDALRRAVGGIPDMDTLDLDRDRGEAHVREGLRPHERRARVARDRLARDSLRRRAAGAARLVLCGDWGCGAGSRTAITDAHITEDETATVFFDSAEAQTTVPAPVTCPDRENV